jgi:hypothetical protein
MTNILHHNRDLPEEQQFFTEYTEEPLVYDIKSGTHIPLSAFLKLNDYNNES